MRLARLHRRLAVLMSLASLLAFASGAGVSPASAILATAGLVIALFWHPTPTLSRRLEQLWVPLALVLVLRALVHVFVIRDDIVIPVVDLLFLLLTAECLRSLETRNDARIYSLSFALLLASTAYRPGLLFLLAFLIYVCLVIVALIVGHLRREGERHGVVDIPVQSSFLLFTGSLSIVTLAVAALVFLTFPRVTRGWAGRGESVATSLAGFADEVTLGSHGSRIYGNPQIVLRVEFPDGAPSDLQSLYWRGRSYDHFDGVRWSRSPRLPPSLAPPAWYERWGRDILIQRIYGAPLDSRVLFALHPLLEVEAESQIQPIFDNTGDYLYWGSGSPSYTAVSLSERPSPSQLRSARGGFIPARGYYSQLPPLSQALRELADSLLAGETTDYDRAITLQRWFQREFTYTLDLPRTPREATLEHFLLRRRAGHCEYFSTAMAVLLRTQGVPTREVNGFLGGSWSQFGNYLAVTQNHAHAWIEVWFPEYGWVPFDPTPGGSGEALASTSWLWPGRFLFDAVQHRWNKWVLDYSLQNQFSLFQRAREVLSPRTSTAAEVGGEESPAGPVGWIVWGLGGILAVVGASRIWRRRASMSPVTRIFLRLRDTCRRRGVPPSALHSPGSLVRYLESSKHPAAPMVRKVVEGYLQARFSGRVLREGQEKELALASREALNLLRRRPR